MSLEAIKTICAAEEEARQAVLVTRKNAQDAVEATKKAGAEIVTSTITRAESEIAQLTRLVDHKATEGAMALASTTANRQATLHARAERRLEAAAQLIFERIVNT